MDKYEIENMINKMVFATTLDLDLNHIREDYYGLHSDIIEELLLKAPGKEKLLYDYVDLLEKEDKIYKPFEAFEAGTRAGAESNTKNKQTPKENAFSTYLKTLELKNAGISSQREKHCIELCGLLQDTTDLMWDFTDLYHTCNSIIKDNLRIFFDMGFNTTYTQQKHI